MIEGKAWRALGTHGAVWSVSGRVTMEPRGEARDTVGQEKYLNNNDQTLSKYGEKRKFIDFRSSVSPKQDEYD